MSITKVDEWAIETSFLMFNSLKMNDSVNGTQINCGCGCLYYPDDSNRFVLSVKHLITDGHPLGIASGFDYSINKAAYSIATYSSFESFKIPQDGTDIIDESIDFIWRTVKPSEKFWYYSWSDESRSQLDKICEMTPFKKVITPDSHSEYIFGGIVECGCDFDRKEITGDRVYYSCKYFTEDEYYYWFELENETDQSRLKGLSGTPIFNRNHELVSLVAGGFKKSKFIKGVNLSKLMPIVGIVGNMGPLPEITFS